MSNLTPRLLLYGDDITRHELALKDSLLRSSHVHVHLGNAGIQDEILTAPSAHRRDGMAIIPRVEALPAEKQLI